MSERRASTFYANLLSELWRTPGIERSRSRATTTNSGGGGEGDREPPTRAELPTAQYLWSGHAFSSSLPADLLGGRTSGSSDAIAETIVVAQPPGKGLASVREVSGADDRGQREADHFGGSQRGDNLVFLGR